MPSIPLPLRCPICESEGPSINPLLNQDASEITCMHCGKFVIEGLLSKTQIERSILTGRRNGLTPEDEKLLPYLSAYIRQTNIKGIVPELDRSNWRDFARAHKTPTSNKLIKLLELVAARSSCLGASVELDHYVDYPLVDAWSDEELYSLLKHLADRGSLDWQIGFGGSCCSITVAGQEFLEQSAGAAKNMSETTPANIIHFHGDVSHAAFQQGTHGSTQIVSFTQEALGDMQEFLKQLKNELSQLNLSEQDRSQVGADIATIEAQLTAPHPNIGIIRAAGNTLYELLLGVGGNFATDLLKYLVHLASS